MGKRANWLIDTNKAFGDIPAAYATLVDLGVELIYRRLLILNTLNADVIIKFTNTSGTVEKLIRANVSSGFDEFWHNDIIEIKYVSSAPTAGFIDFTSWRGE